MTSPIKNLRLPSDAITQTWAIIGRKGSGKTYAAGVLVEYFLGAGRQVVVLDPVGNWFNLRRDAAGSGPSAFDVPVIGGEHGDLPLTPESGALLADFIVDTGTSAVLDVSRFRKTERKRFVADFAEQLFHRKKQRRGAMHVVIEEAQVFCPQKPGDGEQRMLGAMEDIVRLGRNYGIGATMISQRPQSVNKEVLNQAEPLVAFQLVGVHERKAIEEWMKYAGQETNVARLLPELANGDCYISSPAWLRTTGQYRFTEKRTFDGSSTPDADAPDEAVTLDEVDLGALKSAMAEIVEKAKENDPAHLKKEIARLHRELANVDRGIDETEVRARIDEAVDRALSASPARAALEAIATAARDALDATPPPRPEYCTPPERARARRPVTRERPTARKAAGDSTLTGPQQKILNALAWLGSFMAPPFDRRQVAFIAEYSPKSSAFSNPLGALKTAGMIYYPSPGTVEMTDEGTQHALAPDDAVTLGELHSRVLARLTGPQRRLLVPLLEMYPASVTRNDLAEHAQYSPTSSAFSNPLGAMRTLGLIEYPVTGEVCAADVLFPPGLR